MLLGGQRLHRGHFGVGQPTCPPDMGGSSRQSTQSTALRHDRCQRCPRRAVRKSRILISPQFDSPVARASPTKNPTRMRAAVMSLLSETLHITPSLSIFDGRTRSHPGAVKLVLFGMRSKRPECLKLGLPNLQAGRWLRNRRPEGQGCTRDVGRPGHLREFPAGFAQGLGPEGSDQGPAPRRS